MLELLPFGDEHLAGADGLLTARHRRHRAHEPLLPDLADARAEIARPRARARVGQ